MSERQDPLGQTAVMAFPLSGVDAEQPFDLQPPGTTPTALNVCSVDPSTNRARGGSRPGLGRFLPPLATLGEIQELEIIVDPQAEALTADFGELPIGDLIQFEWIDDPTLGFNRYGTLRNLGQVKRGGNGRDTGWNLTKTPTKIVWADPADIQRGDALSATQLNAIAVEAPSGIISLAGTFEYQPPSGTILSRGKATLSVRFTPNDTSYKGSTGKVTINVVDTTGNIFDDQARTETTAVAGTSLPVTLSFNVAIGDTVLLFIATYGASITMTPSDSQGGSYTLIAQRTSATLSMYAYWRRITAAGPLTVTATTNASVHICMSVQTFIACNVSPIDGTAVQNTGTASNTVDSATTTAITVSGAQRVAIGFFCHEAGSPSILSTPGTNMISLANLAFATGDQCALSVHWDASYVSAPVAVTCSNAAVASIAYQAIGFSMKP